MPRSLRRATTAMAACLFISAHAIAATPYPNKAIKIVVPFPAGGLTDTYARMLGKQLQDRLGQPVVVENMPGATGQIGTEKVMRSPADGYTLLYTSNSALVLAPLMAAKPAFNPLGDFTLLTRIIDYPVVVYANPKLAATNAKELVALAKSKPGNITYASVGKGSVGHLSCELFALSNGVELMQVPYKGGSPAQMAVVSGEADLTCDSIGGSQQMADAGKLRPIAVLSPKRVSSAPAIPTAAEAGLSAIDARVWTGLLGPAHMPPATVQILNRQIAEIMSSPEFVQRLAKDGADNAVDSPEKFAEIVKSDQQRWGELIKKKQIQLD